MFHVFPFSYPQGQYIVSVARERLKKNFNRKAIERKELLKNKSIA